MEIKMKSKTIPFVLSFALVISFACSLFNRSTPANEVVAEAATEESPAPESFTLVTIHPAQGDLASVLAFHADQAEQLNRKPFAEFSAEWCQPCKDLTKSLSDARMVEAFYGTYIIRIDIDEWKSQLAKSNFNVLGVPTFFELDGVGQPAGRIITGGAWGEDIPENMAPPLKAFFQGSSDK